jgi:hypothetical protein
MQIIEKPIALDTGPLDPLKRLDNRAPAALQTGSLQKRRGRTGGAKSRSFSPFEGFLKRDWKKTRQQ